MTMCNFLPLIVRHALTNTGWNDSEVTVYSVLIEKGKMSITKLSEVTAIPVSSLQHIIKNLLSKRMIQKKTLNAKPIYIAREPAQLQEWIKGYSKKVHGFESAVEKFVEQYDFHPDVETPKIRQFEGKKGVEASYLEILKLCNSKEINSFFSTPTHVDPDLKEFLFNQYITGRKERQIKNKNIAMRGDIAVEYNKNPQKYANETQIIHQDPNILNDLQNTEINIFDHFVHYMTFDQNKSFGLIINDKVLSSLLQLLFQLLWTLNNKVSLFPEDKLADSYTELFQGGTNNQVLTISTLNLKDSPVINKLLQEKSKIIKQQQLNHKVKTIKNSELTVEITIHNNLIHILSADSLESPQIYLLRDQNLAQVINLVSM